MAMLTDINILDKTLSTSGKTRFDFDKFTVVVIFAFVVTHINHRDAVIKTWFLLFAPQTK